MKQHIKLTQYNKFNKRKVYMNSLKLILNEYNNLFS